MGGIKMADEKNPPPASDKEPTLLSRLIAGIDELLDAGKDPKLEVLVFLDEMERVLDSETTLVDTKLRESAVREASDYLAEAMDGFPMGEAFGDYITGALGNLPPLSLLRHAIKKGWTWEQFCDQHNAFLQWGRIL